MKGRGRGVTELVTYKTVERAHSADRRQGRERANKGTRGKMRRQGGEDNAEVGESFGPDLHTLGIRSTNPVVVEVAYLGSAQTACQATLQTLR